MEISAITIAVEMEDRDDKGRVKARSSSQPATMYAANIPEEVLVWIRSQVKYEKGKEAA